MAFMGDGKVTTIQKHVEKSVPMSDKQRIKHLLSCLISISQGGGTNPRIYAANCVDQYNRMK